jgi:hypothetical protein
MGVSEMADREERVRAKAYELWERAGRPQNQQAEHWEQAQRLIAAEDAARGEGMAGHPSTGPSGLGAAGTKVAGTRKRVSPDTGASSSKPRKKTKPQGDPG